MRAGAAVGLAAQTFLSRAPNLSDIPIVYLRAPHCSSVRKFYNPSIDTGFSALTMANAVNFSADFIVVGGKSITLIGFKMEH
jgi:hypothetical protein